MSTEPTFPADAVPGRVNMPAKPAEPVVSVHPAPIGPAAARTTEASEAEAKSNGWPKVGVGAAIGIGSAAVAAALLYANRNRKGW
jgi:hypothetical protein